MAEETARTKVSKKPCETILSPHQSGATSVKRTRDDNHNYQQQQQKNLFCGGCNKLNHLGKNCNGSIIVCYTCKTVGHKSYECPMEPKVDVGAVKRTRDDNHNYQQQQQKNLFCGGCNKLNHPGKNCNGSIIVCYTCKTVGHKSNECPMDLKVDVGAGKRTSDDNHNYQQQQQKNLFCGGCNKLNHPGKNCCGSIIVCYTCKTVGHKSYECPMKPKDDVGAPRKSFLQTHPSVIAGIEQRLANCLNMTLNEKQFIETALLSDIRVDGRQPFDYRRIMIKFGREDGSSEVQLGQTHVMAFVTAQLGQPYKDRPNEGSLSIFTEFSPMADPLFEAGRPGESAVELGRIIDRGLRESRAIDTESLCVLAGKLAWSVRIDIHILDNGGNLVDAANIAALAALKTFRRPECSLAGEDGQEVTIHPPEVKEPIPLIIHHLPIAVTFVLFTDDDIVVIDPSHCEEAIMKGRMTVTINANGDICAIQKGGGVGIMHSVVMQCLRIASVKAGDITSRINKAVKSHEIERNLRKIKRHPMPALDGSKPCSIMS